MELRIQNLSKRYPNGTQALQDVSLTKELLTHLATLKGISGWLERKRVKVAFQQPPFTSSPELLAELRAVTPEHLQYLIHDFFERMTLYENRALSATCTERPDGKFEVKVTAKSKKLEATGVGTEFEVKLADWMDVGVLDADGKPLFLEKRQITQGDVEFTAVVDKRPAKAGLDPLNKLIDRKPNDNTVAVEKL